ncbi:VWA domain-containing protein [bacterium]|nr:MAG: VWA domain-containing protein [bacterium]
MPKLMDTTMEDLTTSSNYQFSAVKIDELESAKYTLVTVAVDVSGSVSAFKGGLENTLKTILESCKKSPEAESLMLRLVAFNDDLKEIHGFKLLSTIDPSDYDDILSPCGGTALFDAVHTTVEATKDYATILFNQEFDANAIIFIVTDGCDNASTVSAISVKDMVAQTIKDECLDSLNIVLVGVGTDDLYVNNALDSFKQNANLTQYVAMGETTPAKLAKLAQFISRSISSTSQALGSGSASTTASDLLVF